MDFFGSDQSFVRHRADFHPVPDFCPHQQFAEFFFAEVGYVVLCQDTAVRNEGVFVDVNPFSVLGGLFPAVGGTDQSQCLRVQVSGGIGGQVYACLYPVSYLTVGCPVFDGNLPLAGQFVNHKVIRCFPELVHVVCRLFHLRHQLLHLDGKCL